MKQEPETTALVHIVRGIATTNTNDTYQFRNYEYTRLAPRNQKHKTQQGVGSCRSAYLLPA
jgi:hypothetical protein